MVLNSLAIKRSSFVIYIECSLESIMCGLQKLGVQTEVFKGFWPIWDDLVKSIIFHIQAVVTLCYYKL